MIRSCMLAVVGVGVAAAAWAFSAGDAAKGREIALELCAGCHGVPDGGAAVAAAPAFLAIAGTDAETVKTALKRPHWDGGRLSRGDAAHVIAFVDALRME